MKDTTLSVVPGSSSTPTCDVVFFHGLMGDPRKTWEGKDDAGNPTWWPEWVVADHPQASVWIASYDTSLDAMLMPAMSMPNIANAFFDLAELKGLGKRPLLWVGHSMGGLVIKQVLRLSADHSKPEFKAIARSTRAIQFLGTPHQGSTVGSLGVAMREMLTLGLNLASGGATGGVGLVRRLLGGKKRSHLDDLERNAPELLALQDWFGQWTAQQGEHLMLSSYFETQPTGLVKIVDEASGRLGMATAHNVARHRNHIEICKFKDREDAAYQRLSRELNGFANRRSGEVVTEAPAVPPEVASDKIGTTANSILARQLSVTEGRLAETNPNVDSFWNALRHTRDADDNNAISVTSRASFLGDLAQLSSADARPAMWWIRRALAEIPKKDACRVAAQKAAVALYMLCACRWIAAHAEAIGMDPGRAVRIPHMTDVTCSVIATALYGGELRLLTAEGGSSARPEFVFSVPVPDGDCSEALFERALLIQLFPTDESLLDSSRRDQALSTAEKSRLEAEIYEMRKVKKVAFAFVLSVPGKEVGDASYPIISHMNLPVFRFDAEVASRVLDLPDEDLKAEVDQLWRLLVNWTGSGEPSEDSTPPQTQRTPETT